MIIAKKNGKTRAFTDRTWELLGTKKEGWVAMPDMEISNTVKSPAKPSTGSKQPQPNNGGSQKMSNTVNQEPSQPMSNTANTPPSTGEKTQSSGQGDSSGNDNSTASEFSEEQKKEFYQRAEGVNAGVIKDYFDANKIKYFKSAGKDKLIEKLGEVLKYDALEFQKIFS